MADLGFGVLLKRGDGATAEAFTTVAELIGLSGPGLSLDTVESTHTESTGANKEYIAGLKDAGEISADLNFLPANATHTGLIADQTARTLRNFQIVWPDTATTTWSFSAYVTNYEPAAPLEDRMTASVSLKISGVPTFS
jgi:predicted secreted protein